ncbi:hypothetical protein TREMEDRAFT_68869 [Tremella mesenterica DSM 1558]|uniref:uncharacterized protein n=1 Tax=Tremella mesenterica (strain ATCC 24925 / CBS 8224 / DSM 1558 / NBRC 9311 / NRRL Y-6157 / RJB 2259-6 / UBC 559-6) TaxID=578456 RepID=UPI0003F48FA6|nr:uncharacterized protein TREMEDRAFT_68869 [Tremella mesenterica DSM 1558]EIW68930.1 hypothetical protein TREMEDRAFT_68869 [Tremella mesenterica DSM 1558]
MLISATIKALRSGPFGDFRDELAKDGVTVVKNAIPRERALEYRDEAFKWLEAWPFGFKRDDPSTWNNDHLPIQQPNRPGMYDAYGVHHEQFMWDIRTEPGVHGAFAKLWGTEELVSSFDGLTVMLPTNPKPKEMFWPHIDQSPHRRGFFVAQGLVNLNDNGPQDGGLLVMKGSSSVLEQFFDEVGRPPLPSSKIDWHLFSRDEKQWFLDHGCEWVKVCAEPGDLILWSSSTIHQNTPPQTDQPRVVSYVCMGPSHLQTSEDKAIRSMCWTLGDGTTHAPFHGVASAKVAPYIRDQTGLPDREWDRRINPVKPTKKVLQLAGQLPY